MKMKQITSVKKAVAEFASLDEEAAGKIQRIDENPEVIAETEKLNRLVGQLKEAEQKLNSYYEPYTEGQTAALPTVESDAQRVLDGASVATLPTQSTDTEKRNLARCVDVLKQAVEIQKENIRLLVVRIIREGCEGELEPIDQKYQRRVYEKIAEAKKALEDLFKWYAFLSQRGYEQNARPTGWSPLLYETQLLFGGPCSCEYYLEQKAELMGFDDKGKK